MLRVVEKKPGFLPATLKSSLAIGGLYVSHVSLYAGMIVWMTRTFFSPSLEVAGYVLLSTTRMCATQMNAMSDE